MVRARAVQAVPEAASAHHDQVVDSVASAAVRSAPARRPRAAATSARTRNLRKVPGSKAKKKDADRPRGPIPTKFTGRSFSLDDDSPDETIPGDLDDFATSKPEDSVDEGGEE